jgi:hypothetical protein
MWLRTLLTSGIPPSAFQQSTGTIECPVPPIGVSSQLYERCELLSLILTVPERFFSNLPTSQHPKSKQSIDRSAKCDT